MNPRFGVESDPLLAPRPSLLVPCLLGFFVFIAYFLAARTISPGWDEGFTWKRLDALEPWVKKWFQPGTSASDQLSAATLSRSWQFSREEPDGHGPFYALLSYAGHVSTQGFLPPPLSYRVGSISLFSFACALLFRTLDRRWGSWAAGIAVALLATQPRLMAEVCFGVVDGPLVSIEILAFCGFLSAIDRPTLFRIAGFGIPAGCAMATKLTGWVLLGPYIAFAALWCFFRSDFRPLRSLVIGLVFAAATCLFLNVGWWPNPVDGVVRFFRSNLTRNETTHIPNFFMGRTYEFALPWYNTLVWTFVAMPPLAFILGLLGLIGVFTRRTSELVLAGLIWAAIMVVRALPQAPGHDGVRQIIVAFAFFSILGGEGFLLLQRRFGRKFAIIAGLLSVMVSVVGNVAHHPVQLSYYSPLIGTLKVASKNFEPTYFWDALTPEAIEWLNANTPPDMSIVFSSNPANWRYMHRWRILKSPPHTPDLDGLVQPKWYVVQHRTAMLRPEDVWLIDSQEPAYRVSKFGVPLLSVYSVEQYRSARDATVKR